MNVRDLVPWNRSGESGFGLFSPEEAPMASFRREMYRRFDDALRTIELPRSAGAAFPSSWPRLEASENEHEIQLVADVPGIAEKDLELTVANGVLKLRGERKSEVDDRDRGYSERFYGRFERRIDLPQGIMEDRCNATFDKGVLTIHLPKSAEAKSKAKRIPIASQATKH